MKASERLHKPRESETLLKSMGGSHRDSTFPAPPLLIFLTVGKALPAWRESISRLIQSSDKQGKKKIINR